jgi:hypothetical protein
MASPHPCQVARSFPAYSSAEGASDSRPLLFELDLFGKPMPTFPDHASKEETMNGTVYNYRMEGARYGISFGTALAIAISYTNNHSILWAIIHGFFSWLYVIYFALFK